MSLAVRTAQPSDVDAILEVQTAAGRSTSDRFRNWASRAVDGGDEHLCVALEQGAVLGWAATRLFRDRQDDAPSGHYLMGITVAPAHRRRGVAAVLVAARLELLRRDGAEHAYYFTNARNEASIAAHRRWRFRELARGAQFRGVPFDGGEGVLFGAPLAA
ncbi:GNAT family N-acetyltransferase [Microbacterium elymi]|uniref:GNAT family N-acetyltransferase n=1 Tax=Microbacterium elymi TaxID=2909587 RepID=A0ABY5NJ87_9MICO|nr:GNAT family N-acetyltransferase [Microbacterium elymi]UUT35213.1 GNAT family N-acetyltransferase [Microbacterium elymi]